MGSAGHDPVATVVIPTYRRRAGVLRALDSIVEPDLPEGALQVVVVDNASDDGTAEAVRERCASMPGLEFHSWPENVGPLENWRRGIALARAPWLKVVWSDDVLEPQAISRMLFAAERYDARTVTCRVAIDYPAGHAVERYLARPTTLTPDVVSSELLHFPAGLPSSPGAALVRTEDALEALASPLPASCRAKAIGPDLLMTYWGVFGGGLGVHLPDVLARFAAGDDSITVRTPRAVLSSCYGAALDVLIARGIASGATPVSPTTRRRLRSRSALDALLGGAPDARLADRRLSIRATGYDTYQLSRHWFTTHVLGQRGI